MVFALFLTLALAAPHGRRLFSQPVPRQQQRMPITMAAATTPKGSRWSPPPPPVDFMMPAAAAALPAENRTAELMRTRQALLQQVASIDVMLANERNARRAELTAQYERALKELDDEVPVRSSMPAGPHDLHSQIAPHVGEIVDEIRRVPHQDIAHQDIDIDVVLNHIDSDGDGVLTRAEVRAATAGAAVGAAIGAVPVTIVGCLAGIFCYLACRWLVGRSRRDWLSGGRSPQHGAMAKAGSASAAAITGESAVRNRKKQSLASGRCAPTVPTNSAAIAC
jgi:hypothetical protein